MFDVSPAARTCCNFFNENNLCELLMAFMYYQSHTVLDEVVWVVFLNLT